MIVERNWGQIMKNNKIQEFEVFVSSGNFVTISNNDKSPINKELKKNSMNEIVLHLNLRR